MHANGRRKRAPHPAIPVTRFFPSLSLSLSLSRFPLPPFLLQLLHTLVQQGHLSPFPLGVQPVYWEHDYALRLSPLPDVLVLGEARESYEHSMGGMTLHCPGSFGAESSFLFYEPGSRVGESSRVHAGADEGADAGGAVL